eukprot:CAMPEP_0172535286 /NCGR_PEP_ID=MMETSP1067-20121228/7369_1 /TAXON_ID=265564 ORGANISM="Thalassiosira punctigera, Strain Tpunct2005C2" /NCGR_SAMPLE_ID=MMETSP1067 /ASSEMBLY_ACC=CAM_ASM_000444 /LENGTH=109 /DNA_ID=CAMNT_0013320211 /DNA_START=1035 /DNA_END=1361 /DNA_ORIENTATION=+
MKPNDSVEAKFPNTEEARYQPPSLDPPAVPAPRHILPATKIQIDPFHQLQIGQCRDYQGGAEPNPRDGWERGEKLLGTAASTTCSEDIVHRTPTRLIEHQLKLLCQYQW